MCVCIDGTETGFGIDVTERIYHDQLTLADCFLGTNMLSFAISLHIQDFQVYFATSAL